MIEHNCKSCLYDDLCKSRMVCIHYTPMYDEMTDDELDKYIESVRHDYRDEWRKYTDQDAEEAFYFFDL